MKVDPSIRNAGKEATKRGVRRVVIMLMTLGVIAGCALCAHYAMKSAGVFTGLAVATSLAMAFWAACFSNWFGRPTHGTSGGLGVAIITLLLHGIATVVFLAIGISGAWTYQNAFIGMILACGAVDTIFVFTSL